MLETDTAVGARAVGVVLSVDCVMRGKNKTIIGFALKLNDVPGKGGCHGAEIDVFLG